MDSGTCAVQPLGRLGNILIEFAVVWAHCGRTGQRCVLVTGDTHGPVLSLLAPFAVAKAPRGLALLTDDDVDLRAKSLVGLVAGARNRLFKGYFQDVELFADRISELPFLAGLPDRSGPLVGLRRPVVGIHIRCGDYLSPSNTRNYIQLSAAYYERAAAALPFLPGSIALFSDSLTAEALLTGFFPGVDVHFIRCETDQDDMLCMSHCDAVLTANSSFSWWSGCILHTKNPSAPVVIPELFNGPKGSIAACEPRLKTTGVSGAICIQSPVLDAGDLSRTLQVLGLVQHMSTTRPPTGVFMGSLCRRLQEVFRDSECLCVCVGNALFAKKEYMPVIQETDNNAACAERDGWVTLK